jgi:hypothetical protein
LGRRCSPSGAPLPCPPGSAAASICSSTEHAPHGMSLRVRQSPPPPQAALGCSLFRLRVQNFRHRNVLSGPSIICGLLGRERWECASCCALSSSLHSLSFAPDPRRRRLTHLLPLMCNCPVRATPSPDLLLIRRRRLAPQRTAMTLPFSLSSSFRSEWISLSSPSCLARTPPLPAPGDDLAASHQPPLPLRASTTAWHCPRAARSLSTTTPCSRVLPRLVPALREAPVGVRRRAAAPPRGPGNCITRFFVRGSRMAESS